MYKDLEKKFDIRVVEKKLEEGIITSQEYEDYLKNLPDVSSNIDEEYFLGLEGNNTIKWMNPNRKNSFTKET